LSVNLPIKLTAPVVGLWLAAGAALAAAEPSLPPEPSYFEQAGLRVEMETAPLQREAADGRVYALEDIQLQFRVREAVEGGKPVAGLFPLAWLSKREKGEKVPDREACEYQIRGLLAGRLARAADVNLNEYLLLTLDDNNSISIIDPQVESAKTKTLGLVSLTAKGVDFVLAPDQRNVLVTLPTQQRVAAADLFIRKARYVEVGGSPRRITLQPDGRFAWVGDESGESVSAVDVAAFKLAATVPVGPGPHEFTFRDDSRYVFVASPASASLSVIDTHGFERRVELGVGPGAVGVAYSAHSGQAYVALADGTIAAIDGERHERTATISLEPGMTSFAVAPDGRFGFALHQEADRLTIIDLATHKVAHSVPTGRLPDDLDFTYTFAYVRHAGTGDYLLVDLGSLARGGEPLLAPVVMGRQPPAAGPNATIAPTLAQLPEGAGALLLNSADRSIYHFMEGMNAPMGSYRTYPWPARGVLLSDRTIREVEKGLYQTEFKAPSPGVYTLPFLVPTSPQLHGCFTLEVAHVPGQDDRPPSLHMEPLFGGGHVFSPGTPQELRVRLTDPDSGEPVDGLNDVMILVLRGPTWEWRGAAEALGDGRYQVTVTFPKAGQYMVMVSSRSRGVQFGRGRSAVAKVGEALAGGEQDVKETKEER
jgi:DNA-binding beta-propeller fold protein YncE